LDPYKFRCRDGIVEIAVSSIESDIELSIAVDDLGTVSEDGVWRLIPLPHSVERVTFDGGAQDHRG
jgi:hypothetical protein